jgi:hypothetical protein
MPGPITRRAALFLPALTLRAATVELWEIPAGAHGFRGWATLARRKNGELIVAYSGGREAHVCPYGRVEILRSNGEGRAWSHPQVILDTPIDDRDAGVLETPKGSLLVTTFTSLAYEKNLAAAPEKYAHWQAVQRATTQQQRNGLLGQWMLRSTDGGLTWSAPYRVPVNSPHGPVALASGDLIYPGKVLYSDAEKTSGAGEIRVAISRDDGLTWNWLGKIPARPGDSVENYHELHGVEVRPGHLLAQIRNHNPANHLETLQSESFDGGKTWSVPYAIGVWGLPSHLLKLRDGRLLMSYGYRRAPRGNHVRVSSDAGKTWSEPLVLSNDGTGDLGYPSTVELADGQLLTLWYEVRQPGAPAVLRLAKYRLEA